ncbi:hypothetical protein GUJ93_ZPchr0009g660 [Zizania palustris]|uniref:Uncharacterized protein n=1 Tax=Zizania palustris TaxID=103762 RepID=A0A8J5RLE4_ZIZPA|nr:hypothetical protein GUJ93_ZPchr0009g660 [Zizania palustris]
MDASWVAIDEFHQLYSSLKLEDELILQGGRDVRTGLVYSRRERRPIGSGGRLAQRQEEASRRDLQEWRVNTAQKVVIFMRGLHGFKLAIAAWQPPVFFAGTAVHAVSQVLHGTVFVSPR